MSIGKPGYVATAFYLDIWAGRLAAYLKPQRTTRSGQRVTVYRWFTDRGVCCDGLAFGGSAFRMVQHAMLAPHRFEQVAVLREARALFPVRQRENMT